MEKKLADYLFKLKKLPNCNKEDLYRWADFIELKCLANKDGFYSVADFIDDAKPRSEDLREGDYEETEKEIEKKISKAEKNDKWEILAKEALKIISFRVKTFEEFYPFTITDNLLAIELKDEIKEKHKEYIFLLLCSNLQYSIKFKKELTSSFENFSKDVIKKFLPKKAIIKVFGSSNTEDDDEDVKASKFWDKLKFLEEFLKETLIIKKDDISKYNKGDGGLDLLAKIPIGDENTHFPIIFGQCTCSPKDWITKQSSIKVDVWRQLITLKTIPQYFMFIPHSFRDLQGNWFDRTKIHETVMLDRERLLLNFSKRKKFKKYTSFEVIENIINVKEEVV